MVRVGTKALKKRNETRRRRSVLGPRLVPPAVRRVTDRVSGTSKPGAAVPPDLKVVSSTVRWGKVKTAQARMAVDYYDRGDVKEALLDAVLEELSRH